MSVDLSLSNSPEAQLQRRIAMEKEIFGRVVDAGVKAGFKLRLHNGDDWTGPKTDNRKQLKEDCFQTDEDKLFFYKPDQEKGTYYGWVYFVYGNDGHDVISDYTTNLESVLKPVNDYADTLCG